MSKSTRVMVFAVASTLVMLCFSTGVHAKQRWFDQFPTGKFNKSRWLVENNVTWDGNRAVMRASNAYTQTVSGRTLLVLRHKNNGGSGGVHPFSGAEVRSKASVGQGSYRAHLKSSGAKGIDTGFFLYANSKFSPAPGNGSNYWKEIDFEFLGYRTWQIHTNVFQGSATNPSTSAKKINHGSNRQYRTYEIVWRGDYIQWKVNGKEIRKKTDNMFGGKMYIYMNIWSPDKNKRGSWPGWNVGDVTSSATYSGFDWVQSYEY